MITTKATAIAHSNTALIKYWGKENEDLIIPMNSSISITIDALESITTVDFSEDYNEDVFILNGEKETGKTFERVIKHLNLIRKFAKNNQSAKVQSKNNFPTAAGLASSASGFAALTLAVCEALKLDLNKKELSMLSRQGSGSSCRSIFGGFVEWIRKDENNDSYAQQLASKDWLNIRDIVVVFNKIERKWSTREAMKISKETSPLFNSRLSIVEKNLSLMRKAIQDRNFKLIGEIAEQDCLLMHAVALTSKPSQLFWTGETLGIIKFVEALREGGIDAYFTIDTGANMHILTLPIYVDEIEMLLNKIPYVKQTIVSKPGDGAKIIATHLF